MFPQFRSYLEWPGIGRACALLLAVSSLSAQVPPPPAGENASRPERIAIIKADDLRALNEKWDRFLQLAQEKDVKVSIGVIGNRFEAKPAEAAGWFRKWAATGRVEFWNHGWDHAVVRIDANEQKIFEFGDSGYDYQKQHMARIQEMGKALLGTPFTTFGAPNNAMDADTARVLDETPELSMVFCRPSCPVLPQLQHKTVLLMPLHCEADGTGKPNFEKFKELYEKEGAQLTATSLQFHPPYFDENGFAQFSAIIDYLKTQGWKFVLPSEYAERVKAAPQPNAHPTAN